MTCRPPRRGLRRRTVSSGRRAVSRSPARSGATTRRPTRARVGPGHPATWAVASEAARTRDDVLRLHDAGYTVTPRTSSTTRRRRAEEESAGTFEVVCRSSGVTTGGPPPSPASSASACRWLSHSCKLCRGRDRVASSRLPAPSRPAPAPRAASSPTGSCSSCWCSPRSWRGASGGCSTAGSASWSAKRPEAPEAGSTPATLTPSVYWCHNFHTRNRGPELRGYPFHTPLTTDDQAFRVAAHLCPRYF